MQDAYSLCTNQQERRFASRIEPWIDKAVNVYDSDLARAVVMSVLNVDKLLSEANEAAELSAALGEDPVLDADDALAVELLNWFKRDFFTWCNNPRCDFCGCFQTRAIGSSQPTAEEAEDDAQHVELYACTVCGSTTRFPRYNDPIKLLETRTGRCGEFANAFTMCCRAVGLDARLVLDWTDHVCTEYYSPAQKRWIHLDPCEAAFDKPLLYEGGWGKKLSYIIAIGKDGIADVSKRYTKQYNAMLQRRRDVSESWLESFIQARNRMLRENLDESERHHLEARDEADMQAMNVACFSAPTAEELALPGRESGSKDWVASRGEGGGFTAAAKPTPTTTRYAWAKDKDIKFDSDRIVGGVCRASGDNPPAETAVFAFDGRKDTKWLDFKGSEPNMSWLEYRLLNDSECITLKSYSLMSANDFPERDPMNFAVEAFDEEMNDWKVIDERKNIVFFNGRGERLRFKLADTTPPARRWRLRILCVKDQKAATCVQLACFGLYA